MRGGHSPVKPEITGEVPREAGVTGNSRSKSADRQFLRLEEAADRMATSDKYLRGIIQRGEIPVIRMGKGANAPWVVEASDIYAWMDRHKETLNNT